MPYAEVLTASIIAALNFITMSTFARSATSGKITAAGGNMTEDKILSLSKFLEKYDNSTHSLLLLAHIASGTWAGVDYLLPFMIFTTKVR